MIGCLQHGSQEVVRLQTSPRSWKDCATLIVDEGFRPSEDFALRPSP